MSFVVINVSIGATINISALTLTLKRILVDNICGPKRRKNIPSSLFNIFHRRILCTFYVN